MPNENQKACDTHSVLTELTGLDFEKSQSEEEAERGGGGVTVSIFCHFSEMKLKIRNQITVAPVRRGLTLLFRRAHDKLSTRKEY